MGPDVGVVILGGQPGMIMIDMAIGRVKETSTARRPAGGNIFSVWHG